MSTSTRHRRLSHLGNGHAHPQNGHANGDSSTLSHSSSQNGVVFQSQLEKKVLGWKDWVEQKMREEYKLRKYAIGGLDNMWILLDGISGFNPVCTATYTFGNPISKENLRAALEKQIVKFPRYRKRLTNTNRRFHGAIFEEMPEDFDVYSRVKHVSLPEPAGPKELEDFTSSFIGKDWDFDQPLWEVRVIENYKDQDGARSAMAIRGHHTLTDGQGFVLSQIFITSFGDKLEEKMSDGVETLALAKVGKAQPSKINKVLKPLDQFQNSSFPISFTLQLFMFSLYWSFWYYEFVTNLIGSFQMAFWMSFYFCLTFWRCKYATAYQPQAGPRVEGREFSTSKSFKMDDVHLIQKSFSGVTPGGWRESLGLSGPRTSKSFWGHLTLNDILVSVIAEVIQEEIQTVEPPPGILGSIITLSNYFLPSPIPIMIPISIRELGDWSMRNLSTGAIAYVDIANKRPRNQKEMHRHFHRVSKSLTGVKHSLLPRLAFDLIQITGQFPVLYPSPLWTPVKPIVKFCVENVFTSFTAVLTNVPGPEEEIALAGETVKKWTALPPQAGKGTLGIGILSYSDSISVSFSADLVPGSEGAARRLSKAFEERWMEYVKASNDLLK